MNGTCETCGAEAVGFGIAMGNIPNRPAACRDHADLSIVYKRSVGYVQRDEAETHVRETIMEAIDALEELAEFDGIRRDSYLIAQTALGEAFELMRFLEGEAL